MSIEKLKFNQNNDDRELVIFALIAVNLFNRLIKSIFYKKIHKYLGGGKNLRELPLVSALFQCGVTFANFCLHQIFRYFLIKNGL